MSKLKITESKIDSYNDTYNQLERLDEGLNIICGQNEAGKSTLMEFIKNILTKKSSSAKGYIKCEHDGREFRLISGDTKTIKPNEKYLNLNPNEYKTGFVITLDDIMLSDKKDSESLINTIKDSSGDKINAIQQKYYNIIHKQGEFVLTPSDKAGTDFDKQFDKLRDLNHKIEEIRTKQDKYSEVLSELEQLDSEIDNLTKKLQYCETVVQKQYLTAKKEELKINPVLIGKKSEYDRLREELGGLAQAKSKEGELNSTLEELNKKIDSCLNTIVRLNGFELEKIRGFEPDDEILNKLNKIKTKLKEAEFIKSQLDSDLSELKLETDKKEFELTTLKNELEALGIKDIKEYKNDKNMLAGLLKRYSELTDKLYTDVETKRNNTLSGGYSNVLAMIFGAIFFACSGILVMYWSTKIKYLLLPILIITLSGVCISLMHRFRPEPHESAIKTEKNETAQDIIKLLKKLGYKLDSGERFIVKVDCFVDDMNDKIKDYEHTDEGLLKFGLELQKIKRNYETKKSELEQTKSELERLEQEKQPLVKLLNIDNINDCEEVYNLIKEIKSTDVKIGEIKSELEKTDELTQRFADNLNSFTEECELNDVIKLNKYDYDRFKQVTDEIGEILLNNISNQTILQDIDEKLAEYNTKTETFPKEFMSSDVTEETISELQNRINSIRSEKGKLLQQKSDIEQVTDLIDYENKKMVELNKIRNGVSKLMEKEIIFELIKHSKDEFNSIQPNLVSAKQYLEKITNGKYTDIDFDNKTIYGEITGDKSWESLSRGTKEQLYLALRLGYAHNYSKDLDGSPNGQPDLPIIIDDAFVNFDKERTSAILKCLSDFAKTNQVLYFTCHTDLTKEILKTETIEHRLIEL